MTPDEPDGGGFLASLSGSLSEPAHRTIARAAAPEPPCNANDEAAADGRSGDSSELPSEIACACKASNSTRTGAFAQQPEEGDPKSMCHASAIGVSDEARCAGVEGDGSGSDETDQHSDKEDCGYGAGKVTGSGGAAASEAAADDVHTARDAALLVEVASLCSQRKDMLDLAHDGGSLRGPPHLPQPRSKRLRRRHQQQQEGASGTAMHADVTLSQPNCVRSPNGTFVKKPFGPKGHRTCAHPDCLKFAQLSSCGLRRFCSAHMSVYGMKPKSRAAATRAADALAKGGMPAYSFDPANLHVSSAWLQPGVPSGLEHSYPMLGQASVRLGEHGGVVGMQLAQGQATQRAWALPVGSSSVPVRQYGAHEIDGQTLGSCQFGTLPGGQVVMVQVPSQQQLLVSQRLLQGPPAMSAYPQQGNMMLQPAMQPDMWQAPSSLRLQQQQQPMQQQQHPSMGLQKTLTGQPRSPMGMQSMLTGSHATTSQQTIPLLRPRILQLQRQQQQGVSGCSGTSMTLGSASLGPVGPMNRPATDANPMVVVQHNGQLALVPQSYMCTL